MKSPPYERSPDMPVVLFLLIIWSITITPALAGENIKEDEDTLTVVFIEGKETTTSSGLVLHSYSSNEVNFKTSILATKFKDFMEQINIIFNSIPKNIGGLYMDEVELNLMMNAEGGFSLIGKATIGVETGITIKLKRSIKQ